MATRHRVSPNEKSRFAHPFFTSVPHGQRTPVASLGGATRMSDWTAGQVGPIPQPRTLNPVQLASLIGNEAVAEIEAAGTIRIHATGDTGLSTGGGPEEEVALAMTDDFHPDAGPQNPAFFLHLGDVIYGHHKDLLYRDEFYRPYKNYPGKVLAIAGNHDGETFPQTDTTPCGAFLDNFCAPGAVVPPAASGAGVFRETMILPGVFWLLDAPLVQIIGLYSNIVDGPGYLVGKGNDTSQVNWLKDTLSTIAGDRKKGSRKALLIAVHHPPYSSAGHAGSAQVLASLDSACKGTGVMPDAILSGHAHNYQRYTRRTTLTGIYTEVPYVVAGCGGHAAQPVPPADHSASGDHTYDGARKGYGYLLITVTAALLQIDAVPVPHDATTPFDSVALDLASRRIR